MRDLLKLWGAAAALACAVAMLAHRNAHAQSVAQPVQDPAQLITEQQWPLEQPPASITVASIWETTLDIPADTPVDAINESGPTFAVRRIVLRTPSDKPFEPPSGDRR